MEDFLQGLWQLLGIFVLGGLLISILFSIPKKGLYETRERKLGLDAWDMEDVYPEDTTRIRHYRRRPRAEEEMPLPKLLSYKHTPGPFHIDSTKRSIGFIQHEEPVMKLAKEKEQHKETQTAVRQVPPDDETPQVPPIHNSCCFNSSEIVDEERLWRDISQLSGEGHPYNYAKHNKGS